MAKLIALYPGCQLSVLRLEGGKEGKRCEVVSGTTRESRVLAGPHSPHFMDLKEKVASPAAVGVPLSIPRLLSPRPAGSAPELTDQV